MFCYFKRLACSIGWLVLAGATTLEAAAAAAPLERAPNLVAISQRLVTSGQPSAEALASLGAQGFEAVVYLAPPTVQDAVRDEALIVARQGLVFVNVPIRFDQPTERDFEAVSGVLQALADRKVLVQCQINLRASTLVFPRVWAPEGAWKTFVQQLLQKRGVAFDPF